MEENVETSIQQLMSNEDLNEANKCRDEAYEKKKLELEERPKMKKREIMENLILKEN